MLDRLMEMFQQQRDCEIAYVMNWMGSAPNAPLSVAKRILNTYIEENMWYLPLEVGSGETPLTSDDTLDVRIYNPRAWTKDSVPDLYEGAVETRYTAISYLVPRAPSSADPSTCPTSAAAQKNMVLSCLLTEGVGIMARRLKEDYQPFLLRTLCLVLERVGCKYEMLHLAGLKAINDIAIACGHNSVADLIRCNADYFTNQVTLRLKKAWNSKSALQILSVVMEYSDSSILDCLYGIVENVLVQSCDKYHQRDLQAYLQVFLTFIECIRKWFPPPLRSKPETPNEHLDIFKYALEYIESQEETERLLSNEEMEKESGKSIEEMYKEDLKKKEDDVLDYDDRVTEEKPPLPQHIKVTITVLKRCINFMSSKHREETILALQIFTSGLPILVQHEDELLPLVHQSWAPLVSKVEGSDVVVLKKALDLLVVMAGVSKDFIRNRAV
ncbi:TELO2-interacting protein 1 homolog, partial [Hyposmocoma kahamanoa]|uniref:TELO2-interacting protein 1 homolog n=1 Tax=Hyposmocoma kahamanoa TaxID=1477025 RepID=UPI000E6D5E49